MPEEGTSTLRALGMVASVGNIGESVVFDWVHKHRSNFEVVTLEHCSLGAFSQCHDSLLCEWLPFSLQFIQEGCGVDPGS